jgi:hypothetical protein
MRLHNAHLFTTCSPHSVCLREAYARLREAHDRGGKRGRPLLTADGEAYLREALAGDEATPASGSNGVARHPWPRWEAGERWLWLGDRLIKVFRQPAPHQALLLSAFQDHSWSLKHIDDPLPLAQGETREEAKRRLHETIRNLNRSLPPGSIRFRGDGTGQGVIWEYDFRQADGFGH